jgi:hypothetical protein
MFMLTAGSDVGTGTHPAPRQGIALKQPCCCKLTPAATKLNCGASSIEMVDVLPIRGLTPSNRPARTTTSSILEYLMPDILSWYRHTDYGEPNPRIPEPNPRILRTLCAWHPSFPFPAFAALPFLPVQIYRVLCPPPPAACQAFCPLFLCRREEILPGVPYVWHSRVRAAFCERGGAVICFRRAAHRGHIRV